MSYSRIILFLSIALILGLTSCHSTKCKSNKYLKQSISLEKTACFGTCPQYIFTINGIGEMEFMGKKFTKMDGEWSAQLKQVDIVALFAEINDANLMKLEDAYPSNYSDLPASIITFNNGKKIKTIRIEGTHPVVLDEVINKIVLILDSASWVNQNTN